jgi:hypothetical protein
MLFPLKDQETNSRKVRYRYEITTPNLKVTRPAWVVIVENGLETRC